MKINADALSTALAERLCSAPPKLTALDVECAWPVFKATLADGERAFVKVTTPAAASRALAFLNAARAATDCPFLSRPVLTEAFAFGDHAVLCLEWKDARQVNAEDMTDAQLESFVEGCVRLSEVLRAATAAPATAPATAPSAPLKDERQPNALAPNSAPGSAADSPRSAPARRGKSAAPSAPSPAIVAPDAADLPRSEFEVLRAYASRHPVAARLITPLLAIPEAERDYAGRVLVPIHGDFQPKNYGFAGERFAAVFDTDDLTLGLACEDAAYAFTERARRSSLSAAKRLRLAELFRRMVAISPWPKDEWIIAVNHSRLRIAERRVASHPDSAFIAFDVRRRDQPLRSLLC